MAYQQAPNASPTSDDLYGDGAPSAQESPDESPEGKQEPEPEKEESSEPTAVLPKSILAGKEFKPGDEVVLKIVSLHDDEVVVEYATEPEKKESPAAAAPASDSPYD